MGGPLFQFDQPALWPLALVAVVPWVIALRARRHGRSTPWTAPLMQSLALVAVAAALARPRVASGPGSSRPVAVFVDASASQTGLPERLAVSLHAEQRRVDYVFADGVARLGRGVGADRSRILPALAILNSRIDPPAAVVFATDGRFDDPPEQIAAAAAALGRRGIPVFVVPRAPDAADARVTALSVRRGHGKDPAATPVVHVSATVVATGSLVRTLVITRSGAAKELLRRTLNLRGGEPATVWAIDHPPAGGRAATEYRAELIEADLLARNNVMTAVAPGEGPEVLWVTGAPGAIAPPAAAGVTFTPIAAAALRRDVDALLPYAAVVVVDAGGEALTPAQRKALAGYVETLGGGLVMVGTGPYARPDDRDDPLNRVLPLWASPYERRSLDVTVVLDASGSMAEPASRPGIGGVDGTRKFDLVRQATLAMAGRQLTAGDMLRVITFSEWPTLRYTGTVGPDFLAALSAALADVRPGGGTKVIPAMEAALEAAGAAGETGTRDRLVIILSDLQTEKFPTEPWARRFTDAGVALAVVSTGRPTEAYPLKRLVDRLGGQSVYGVDLSGLADVFVRFLREARGDVRVRRETAVKVVGPLFGLPAELPDIDTFLSVAERGEIELLARTAAGDPLIARHRVGLGRVVSVALPLEGPHNPRWRKSKIVGSLLSAAAAWAAGPAGDARYDAEVTRRGQEVTVTVHALAEDDSPINGKALTVEWSAGSDRPRKIDLKQTAPGTYTAALGRLGSAAAMLVVRDGDEGQAGRVLCRHAVPGRYPDELTRLVQKGIGLGDNVVLLSIGGEIVDLVGDRGSDPDSHRRQLGKAPRNLWCYHCACFNNRVALGINERLPNRLAN